MFGYGFSGHGVGTVGVVVPRDEDLEDPVTKAKYQERLKLLAKKVGFAESEIAESAVFDGQVQMAEKIRAGNLFLIGDAARTTDPIAGLGVNMAIWDAKAAGNFVRESRDLGPEVAMSHLVERIRSDSKYSIESSLYFQDLLAWLHEHPWIVMGGDGKLSGNKSVRSKQVRAARNFLLDLAEYLPGGVVRTAARKGSQLVGAPKPPEYGDTLRTRDFTIHELNPPSAESLTVSPSGGRLRCILRSMTTLLSL